MTSPNPPDDPLEAAARTAVCPLCGGTGLVLSYQLAAKSIGDFSLSGHQMKFSALRYPVVTCEAVGCNFRASGKHGRQVAECLNDIFRTEI